MGNSTNKGRGALAELQVATKIRSLGGEVSFPHGDTAGYDLIAEFKGRTSRLQVKSTTWTRGTTYSIQVTHGGKNQDYSKEDFDYLCAVVPFATFVIPIGEVKARKITFFQPGEHRLKHSHPKCLHEQYREAWHLLMP
jgi:hypothetical protein